MSRMKRIFFLLFLVLTFYSPVVAQSTPEATVKRCFDAVQRDKPVVIYNLLPASYKKDVTDIVRGFGKHIDAKQYAELVSLGRELSEVFKTKSKFLVKSPMFADAGSNETERMAVIKSVAIGLDALLASDAADATKLRRMNVQRFLAAAGEKPFNMLARMISFSEIEIQEVESIDLSRPVADPELEPEPVMGVTHTLKQRAKLFTWKRTQADAQGITLVFTRTDKPSRTITHTFVKVEGKWIPKDLVDNWPDQIQAMKEGLPQINQMLNLPVVIGAARPVIAAMKAAKTQVEFDAAAAALGG